MTGQSFPVSDPKLHILCYRIETFPQQPPVNQAVIVNNQFGPMKFIVQGFPAELCLPTGKVKAGPPTKPETGGALD